MAIESDNDNWFARGNFSMKISRDGDGSATVKLTGDFDLSTAAELRECFVSPEVLDAERVTVDLTRVTFIDSSSIGLLISACRAVRKTGGAFSLRCVDGIALRVLQISGLVEFLEVETVDPDREAPIRDEFIAFEPADQ
jgi:anti-sigma B factor antagonist